MAQDDKTELPTQRRIQEARRRGQIARSHDLTQAAGLAPALVPLSFVGPPLGRGLAIAPTQGISRLSVGAGHELAPGEVNGLAIRAAMSIGLLVGPVALAGAAGVFAAQIGQSGWNVATEALQLNFGRLNPANGFRRFGLKQGGVQTLKALAVVGIVFYLAWPFVAELAGDSQHLVLIGPMAAAAEAWGAVRGLLWKTV